MVPECCQPDTTSKMLNPIQVLICLSTSNLQSEGGREGGGAGGAEVHMLYLTRKLQKLYSYH